MRLLRRNALAVAFLVICLMSLGFQDRFASAQVLYGSIVGTVTDPTGAVVSKATVTVTNTSTGLSRQTSADDAGYYSIPNLPQGAYDLAVSAVGFKPLTQKGVNVSINNFTRPDIGLEGASVNASVTAQPNPPALPPPTT